MQERERHKAEIEGLQKTLADALAQQNNQMQAMMAQVADQVRASTIQREYDHLVIPSHSRGQQPMGLPPMLPPPVVGGMPRPMGRLTSTPQLRSQAYFDGAAMASQFGDTQLPDWHGRGTINNITGAGEVQQQFAPVGFHGVYHAHGGYEERRGTYRGGA